MKVRMKDVDDWVSKFGEYLDSLTPEELRAHQEKYFPKRGIPVGWVDIEKHLPHMMAEDIMKGCTEYKVKFSDGTEDVTCVSDHAVWYYEAKEVGITHWWNDIER